MHIVISRAVGEFEETAGVIILLHIIEGACGRVALRITLRSVHEALGVVGVIEFPVIHSPTCDAAAENFRMGHHQHGCHGSSKGKAFHADSVRIHIGQRLEIPAPLAEILHRHAHHIPVNQVYVRPSVVACSPAVGRHLDDAVVEIPDIALRHPPGVPHIRGVGTSVDFHHERILLRRVEILWI